MRPNPIPDIFDQLKEIVHKYLYLEDERYEAVLAAWIIHTYFMDCMYTTPRLLIRSAIPGCGKTRALELLHALCNNAIFTSDATGSPVMRTLAAARADGKYVTYLLDEAETYATTVARAGTYVENLLRSGYKKGGKFHRSAKVKESYMPEELDIFGPVAIGMIGEMPSTIKQRSIDIEMFKNRNRQLANFEPTAFMESVHALRIALAELKPEDLQKEINMARIANLDLRNREREIWEPLLSVAAVAGNIHIEEMIQLICFLEHNRELSEEDYQQKILESVSNILPQIEDERIRSEDLLKLLLKEDIWLDYSDIGLNQNLLALLLRPFKIRTKTMRTGPDTPRCYAKSDLQSAVDRYMHIPRNR